MHVQVKFLAEAAIAGVTLVLLDALVELKMHLQASILSKRGIAARVRALVRLVTGMRPQVSEEPEHPFVNRPALLAIFYELAPKYLMVLLDTMFHAEVVHHEIGAVWDMPLEFKHIFVEFGALNRRHLKIFGNMVFLDKCIAEHLVARKECQCIQSALLTFLGTVVVRAVNLVPVSELQLLLSILGLRFPL